MKRSDSACTFLRVGQTFLNNFARVAVFMCVLPLAIVAITEMSAMGVDCSKIENFPPYNAMLSDIRTVIPQKIQLINKRKREIIRFTNGIANVGDGPWRMRPEFPSDDSDPSQPQKAVQEILDSKDSSGDIVCEEVVSEFDFHPEHNHWHIDDVAFYEMRYSNGKGWIGSDDIGEVVVNDRGKNAEATKVTFCLIDWIKLAGNSNTTDRIYWDCAEDYQGISVGWVDAYHHSLPDQDIDITGADPGIYYLVSTANPDCIFIENDCTNNRAWVAFKLRRDSNGNPKITIIDNSLIENEGVEPDYTTNR